MFQISYIVFLVLFSLVLLLRFEDDMSVPEYILIFWVSTLLIEEIRQVERWMNGLAWPVQSENETVSGLIYESSCECDRNIGQNVLEQPL